MLTLKNNHSDYLSNPYPTKLHIESNNFLEDFSKKNLEKKNYDQNLFLDKKIKNCKSDYQKEEQEKEFERILSYKKLISHKNSLYFESLSPTKAKTGNDFFTTKKSKANNILLPKLSKTDLIDAKIKTTSKNFFKNKIPIESVNNKNNDLLLSSSKNSFYSKENLKSRNNCNSTNNNQIENNAYYDKNLKTVSVKRMLTKKESENERDTNTGKAYLQSQSKSSNNLKNFNEVILKEINNLNNDNTNNKTNNNIESNNILNNVVSQQNNNNNLEHQTVQQQAKNDLELCLPLLESKESINKNNIKSENENENVNEENNTSSPYKNLETLKSERELNNKPHYEAQEDNKTKLAADNDKINTEEKAKEEEELKTEKNNQNTRNENKQTVLTHIKKPNKSSSKTLNNAAFKVKFTENSFYDYDLKESANNENGNRTYLFSSKNRIVIESADKTTTVNDIPGVIISSQNDTKQQLKEQDDDDEEKQEKKTVIIEKTQNENIINNQGKEALDRLMKLEEIELNKDLSLSNKDEKDEYSRFQKSKIHEINNNFNNDNEKVFTVPKSLIIENETHESKLKLNNGKENSQQSLKIANDLNNLLNENLNLNTKTSNKLQNSLLKLSAEQDSTNNAGGIIIIKQKDDVKSVAAALSEIDIGNFDVVNNDNNTKTGAACVNQEIEFRNHNNSKENISNYFAASNQNFYSNAAANCTNINNNNFNSNFNFNKNYILGFDKSGSSNNLFSLTTVNNFNSNYLWNNNHQKHLKDLNSQSPIPRVDENISPISKNYIKSLSKAKSTISNNLFQQTNLMSDSKQRFFSIQKPQKKSVSPHVVNVTYKKHDK